MAEIVRLDEVRQSRKARKTKSKSGLKPKKLGKSRKGIRWSAFKTGTLSMPLATEMMRAQQAAPAMEGQSAVLESGVLAFRRDEDGGPRILLISRKRSKKWGIPKGKVEPMLTFPETAAKEAFEEAGVVGYISPSSVGMFRAKKRTGPPPRSNRRSRCGSIFLRSPRRSRIGPKKESAQRVGSHVSLLPSSFVNPFSLTFVIGWRRAKVVSRQQAERLTAFHLN
jgi:hypothetical protein